MFKSEIMRKDAENLVMMTIILGVISVALMTYGAFMLLDLGNQSLTAEEVARYPSLVFVGYLSVLIYGAQKAIQYVGQRVCYKVDYDRSKVDAGHNILTLPILPSLVLVMFSVIVLGKVLDLLFIGGLLSALASGYIINKWLKAYLLNHYEPSYIEELKIDKKMRQERDWIKAKVNTVDTIDELKKTYRNTFDSAFDNTLEHVRERVVNEQLDLDGLNKIQIDLQNVRRGIDARRSLSKLKKHG